jgi:hypothetical protein
MRKTIIVVLVLFVLFLAWAPLPGGEMGAIGGRGTTVTRLGIPGAIIITTEVSWYGLGNVPVYSVVELSWIGLTISAAMTAIICSVGFWFWKGKHA